MMICYFAENYCTQKNQDTDYTNTQV